jgi:hypothetical protein
MQERFALLRLAALAAPQDEDGLLMQRMKDSNLHRVWRLTDMLSKLRNGAPTPRDVKNEDRSGYVYENKGEHDKMSSEKPAVYTKTWQLRDNRQQSVGLCVRDCRDLAIMERGFLAELNGLSVIRGRFCKGRIRSASHLPSQWSCALRGGSTSR